MCPPVLRMVGYSKAELIGQRVDVLIPEPFASAHQGYLERFADTGVEVGVSVSVIVIAIIAVAIMTVVLVTTIIVITHASSSSSSPMHQ